MTHGGGSRFADDKDGGSRRADANGGGSRGADENDDGGSERADQKPRTTVRQRVALVVILVACVVGRGAYVVHLAHHDKYDAYGGDTVSYLLPAKALVHDHRFHHNVHSPVPEFLRTPGYPAFIAGVDDALGTSVATLLLVQVLVSVATVLLVFVLGTRLWSPTVGLIAAALVALEPSQWLSSARILSECLDTLLLVLTALAGFVVFRRDRPGVWWPLLFGTALAAATMVRPVTYYLPLVVLALFAVRAARHPHARRATIVAALTFMVPIVVVLGGWQLRNHAEVGSWRLSGVEGKNLLQFRAAAVLADARGIPVDAARADLYAQLDRTLARLDTRGNARIGAHYDTMYRQGLHVLTSHPASTVKETVLGLGAELAGVRLTLDSLSLPFLTIPALLLLYAAYALAIYAFVRIVQSRRHVVAHIVVVATAVYVLTASAGPEAFGGRGERFRAPIMPLVLLYAAAGAVELVRRVRPAAATTAEPGTADA
jgi:4-amino-4-deoxy-L-arabinose transferase-like glycosyltransferase